MMHYQSWEVRVASFQRTRSQDKVGQGSPPEFLKHLRSFNKNPGTGNRIMRESPVDQPCSWHLLAHFPSFRCFGGLHYQTTIQKPHKNIKRHLETMQTDITPIIFGIFQWLPTAIACYRMPSRYLGIGQQMLGPRHYESPLRATSPPRTSPLGREELRWCMMMNEK